MSKLVVSSLTSYPVKSAGGISLEKMQLDQFGPSMDRRWMLVDQNGTFLTQRKLPKICLISTTFSDNGVRLSTANIEDCQVPKGGSQQIVSSVWGSEVMGEDCGDRAAEWVSSVLGKQCRIIYMPDDYSRLVDTDYARSQEKVGFADGFPVLIASQSSLEDFNSKLGFEIGMNRFRPNIIISGDDAWAEDHWARLMINDIEFSLVKPCSRCIMPSVNPETGLKEMEVNAALMKHRRRDRETYFGQNALYNKLGSIRVGDSVTVLENA